MDAQSKVVHILINAHLMLYILDLEKFTKKSRRIQNYDKIFKTDEKKKRAAIEIFLAVKLDNLVINTHLKDFHGRSAATTAMLIYLNIP